MLTRHAGILWRCTGSGTWKKLGWKALRKLQGCKDEATAPPEPKLYRGRLSPSCKGNTPSHSALRMLLPLNVFVSNLFGRKGLTPAYYHKSFALISWIQCRKANCFRYLCLGLFWSLVQSHCCWKVYACTWTDTPAKHSSSSFLKERNFSFSSWHSNLFPIISAAKKLSLLVSSSLMYLHRSYTIHQTKAAGVRGLHLAFEGCDSKLSNNTIFIAFPRLITVATKTLT